MSLLTKIERPLKVASNNATSSVPALCNRCGASTIGDETGCFRGLCPTCAEISYRLEKKHELRCLYCGSVLWLFLLFCVWYFIWDSGDSLSKFLLTGLELALMHFLLQHGLKSLYTSINDKWIKRLYFLLAFTYVVQCFYVESILKFTAILPLIVCVIMLAFIVIRLHQKGIALGEYVRANATYVTRQEREYQRSKSSNVVSAASLNPELSQSQNKGLDLDLLKLGQEELKNGDN